MYIARRDEEGAVIIAPKNITTNNVKKGGVDKALFSHPTYGCVDEPYKNPGVPLARTTNMGAIANAGHEKNWVFAKKVKERDYHASYEHMTDRREIVKNYRDEEGAVIIAPRNFLTNPIKAGRVGKQTTLGGIIEH